LGSGVQIVFDNYVDGDMHGAPWGFAAYLPEYGLLMDTGSNGRVLLRNMAKLGIDPAGLKYLVITHNHWDHIGGIDSILELNDHLIIYVPYTLSKNHIGDLRAVSSEVIVVEREPIEIEDGLYSTGILGRQYPEHSLILDGNTPTVVTGCGHFGIGRITEHARSIIGRDIEYVVGGFHLQASSSEEIGVQIDVLAGMGVRYATATHCSGLVAMEMFDEAFTNPFLTKI